MIQQTWLDKAIGWAFPKRAARRLQARATISALSGSVRRYQGAAVGRRTDGWITPGTSADAEIAPQNARLRNRARDLVRNNPWAANAVKVLASNIVGPGIVPRTYPDSKRRTLARKVNDLWWQWNLTADARGRTDFYGLQTQIVRTLVESGEVLVRRRMAPGLVVPFQLEVMECDRLDSGRDGTRDGGGWISQGIEYDAAGQRAAYWLFPQHPGGSGVGQMPGMESVRHPAAEILHIFDPLRSEQSRGVTWFAPAIMRLNDVDEFDEAVLVARKIQACSAAFVLGTSENVSTLGLPAVNEEGQQVETFEPGMIVYPQGATDVKFHEPKGDGTYPDYMRTQLHAVGAALGVPYELLTGDLSQVSFISARFGRIQLKALVGQIRAQILEPQLLRPVWRWFVDIGQAAGVVPTGQIDCRWTYPQLESVQPKDDMEAALGRIRMGLSTWPEEVAALGFDPDEQLAEIGEWNGKFDAAEVVLDSDPRKVAKSGAVQAPAEPASPKEPPR